MFGIGSKPSENARRIMEHLGCPCEYFPAGKNPAHIQAAYEHSLADVKNEPYIPVIIHVDDILAETLEMFEEELESGETLSDRRKKLIARAEGFAEAWFTNRLSEMKEQYGQQDWEQLIGSVTECAKGENNTHFSGYVDFESGKTCEAVLAKIPVENPWEVFAWVPFGGWNECPSHEEMLVIGKYWYQRYKAVPAVISHDTLEFAALPVKDKSAALGLALEQFAFCGDIIYQGTDTVGRLAGILMQSSVWYFWWD